MDELLMPHVYGKFALFSSSTISTAEKHRNINVSLAHKQKHKIIIKKHKITGRWNISFHVYFEIYNFFHIFLVFLVFPVCLPLKSVFFQTHFLSARWMKYPRPGGWLEPKSTSIPFTFIQSSPNIANIHYILRIKCKILL